MNAPPHLKPLRSAFMDDAFQVVGSEADLAGRSGGSPRQAMPLGESASDIDTSASAGEYGGGATSAHEVAAAHVVSTPRLDRRRGGPGDAPPSSRASIRSRSSVASHISSASRCADAAAIATKILSPRSHTVAHGERDRDRRRATRLQGSGEHTRQRSAGRRLTGQETARACCRSTTTL